MTTAKPPPIKLRFLLAWGAYSKGAVIVPPGVLRDHYLGLRWYGRKVVEVVQEVETPAPPPEVVVQSATGFVAQLPPAPEPPKRKPGRPRKDSLPTQEHNAAEENIP